MMEKKEFAKLFKECLEDNTLGFKLNKEGRNLSIGIVFNIEEGYEVTLYTKDVNIRKSE